MLGGRAPQGGASDPAGSPERTRKKASKISEPHPLRRGVSFAVPMDMTRIDLAAPFHSALPRSILAVSVLLVGLAACEPGQIDGGAVVELVGERTVYG